MPVKPKYCLDSFSVYLACFVKSAILSRLRGWPQRKPVALHALCSPGAGATLPLSPISCSCVFSIWSAYYSTSDDMCLDLCTVGILINITSHA